MEVDDEVNSIIPATSSSNALHNSSTVLVPESGLKSSTPKLSALIPTRCTPLGRRASISSTTGAAFKRRMTLAALKLQELPSEGVADTTSARTPRSAPITRDDVDMTFETMSRGGKKIKREDAKAFVQYFCALVHGEPNGGSANNAGPGPATLSAGGAANASKPPAPGPSSTGAGGGVGGEKNTSRNETPARSKAMKLASSGKEELTRERLMSLLLNKSQTAVPFEEAFQWFEPHGGDLGSANMALNESDLRRIAMAMSPYGMVHKGDVAALLAHFDMDGDGVIGLRDFEQMTV